MNSLIKFVLKNKLAVWLLTIIVAAAGVYSGTKMKLETIPDITVPIATVTTVYPGATPQQVADDISIPFEKAVNHLKGVSAVYSNSYQNASSLQIEFKYETDMKEAVSDIKEALEKVELPETAQKPTVDRVNINAFPVVALSVANKDQSIADLTKTTENYFVPKLEGVDGVASVTVSGQQVEKVELTYDQKKLAKYGLTEDTIKQYVQAMDTQVPLGMFQFKDEEQSVVVDGKMTTIKDLKNLEIPVTMQSASANAQAAQAQAKAAQANVQGAASAKAFQQTKPFVKLGELASIKVIGDVESVSRTNGQSAIAVQVVKSQEANTVDVVNDIKDEAKKFEKENKGMDIEVTLDQGQPIEDSVQTMLDKALFGAIFAVIIIMLFLRNVRSTIISIISIPMSLLIAVTVLKQMDISLNMMTLGAMTVAIGRVIDDSIVVVENIYRRIYLEDEKLHGRALIREATIEMFKPILSSTIVTIAVFLPLGLVGGMVGELFLPFGLTMAFALIASLIVAITIVPVLAHTLFKKELYGNKKTKKEEHGKLSRGYKRILSWVLDHKWTTSIISIVILVASLFLTPLVGFSFLPDDQQKMVYLTYTPEPGETRDKVIDDVEVIEKMIMDKKDVKTVQSSIGGSNPMMPGASNGALVYVIYDTDTENFGDVKEKLIKEVLAVNQKGTWKSQDFTSTGSSNELSYSVYGNTVEDIRPVIKDIEKLMKKQDNLKDVKTSLAENYAEKTLVIDQDKVKALGLTTGQIAMAINPNTQTEVLTTVTKDGKELDVNVHKEAASPEKFQEVLNEELETPVGKKVKVSDVVKVKEGTTSTQVNRSKGKIYANVTATVTSKDITKASSAVQKDIDKLDIPNNVNVDTGGVAEDMNEAFSKLGLAIAAAIAIVYFTLVVTFGEGLAPFAILFSLPFTVIGALVALYISGETISVSSLIGLLMLIGIVVTNAIVLVDRIIHMEHAGMTMREAILEAGATRLRPILMTAIATIGALIPLAIGAEGGGLISKGVGVTVIGGLISSTILTLVIVPLVYELISKILKKDRAHENKED
ncbi:MULTISPECIES: efflux RND transporter permease subunit [unclassified Rummeliibacillus]|uniref:efflux RND transporter permease subunit n=1 Tax=unclassified Rummeliibacillus TaxID=2622809 RepID=UPI000E65F378|nr:MULTISPECIES: efflux RND transporter permease subunit [unclassified Rummeliibacillus]RIJ67745.1 efflux RND transporter permease subunit [Rummeliibacillus sp. POC4]RPJ94218.1 efflux RND transporter permease subunit [Rummeliibacillus sp. TYF005]